MLALKTKAYWHLWKWFEELDYSFFRFVTDRKNLMKDNFKTFRIK